MAAACTSRTFASAVMSAVTETTRCPFSWKMAELDSRSDTSIRLESGIGPV